MELIFLFCFANNGRAEPLNCVRSLVGNLYNNIYVPCKYHIQIVNAQFPLAFGYDKIVKHQKGFVVYQFRM